MYPKISIIIPVYNAEKNIEKCLDSIIKQTYSNLEIICINDGSIDNSENLIKDIQNKDSRVILFSKKNSGVSDTRNYGIEQSTGEYIMFIDADDYIEDNYIEVMIKTAIDNNCDMVISSFTQVKDNILEKKNCNILEEEIDITYPKQLKHFLCTSFFNSCWKQLIKRDLLGDKLRFNVNIKYGEDMLFSFECYNKSKCTYFKKNYGYYYYINPESVMQRTDIRSLKKYFDDNISTTDLITSKYNLTETEKKMLYFKTLLIFVSVSEKLAISSDCYKSFKNNYLIEKEKYKKFFHKYNCFKYGTLKQKILIFLLKYNMPRLFYFIKNK